jgi:dGTP triphosphohydrolase
MTRSPYASDPARSRGRLVPEPDSAFRTCFARDRDRIIHSSAFRRLKHKTQVFVEHEGDYYRTRLTHTLEVAQVARTLAVALGLDEDLTEAVALAHDLGHPPFGHTGEEALDRLMAPHGGFDHKAQAVRIVTVLVAAWLLLGAATESLQLFTPDRTMQFADWTANVVGVGIGLALAEILPRLVRRFEPKDRSRHPFG